jgi:hypothetical protein
MTTRYSAFSRGRSAFQLTVIAFMWSLGLILVAFTVPTEGVSSGRAISRPGAESVTVTESHGVTLFSHYGLKIVALIAIPAIISGAVWVALHRKCNAGSLRAGKLAWGMIVLLTMYAFVGGFSVGLWAFPVVALLAAAAARTPAGSR